MKYCKYEKFMCPFDCGEGAFIKDFDNHFKNTCTKVEVKCKRCNIGFMKHELEQHDCFEALKRTYQN